MILDIVKFGNMTVGLAEVGDMTVDIVEFGKMTNMTINIVEFGKLEVDKKCTTRIPRYLLDCICCNTTHADIGLAPGFLKLHLKSPSVRLEIVLSGNDDNLTVGVLRVGTVQKQF
jgi:hypothetical protein